MDSTVPTMIHFLDDGLTALGKVWYRGEELAIDEEVYEASLDRNRKSWLTTDPSEQVARWGRVRFAPGPWPGAEYEEPEAKQAASAAKRPAFLESAPIKQTSTALKVFDDQPPPLADEDVLASGVGIVGAVPAPARKTNAYNEMRNKAKMLGIHFTNGDGSHRNPSREELEQAISDHLEAHGNVALTAQPV